MKNIHRSVITLGTFSYENLTIVITVDRFTGVDLPVEDWIAGRI